ncbi:thermonuclease family protein [Waterburya agarophytonicola]|nr:thermonuclease family protein [Waterburya agarophytonicola]
MKRLLNSSSLLIGLILVFIGILDNRETINNGIEKALSRVFFKDNYADLWQVKPGSIYDGDTLRVVRGNEELKIRICGIDAPELKQPLGIESRDYLRSLIAQGNGTIHVLPIETDRYDRTVAELWIPIKPDYEAQIHLNTAMVEAGYAYHYQQYSDSCVSAENLGWAEKIARDEKLGVWNGNHQKPWKWRSAKKYTN